MDGRLEVAAGKGKLSSVEDRTWSETQCKVVAETVALAGIKYDTRPALQQAQVVLIKTVRARGFVEHTVAESAENIVEKAVEESAENIVEEAVAESAENIVEEAVGVIAVEPG